MTWSASEQARVQTIEKMLVSIQQVLNNLSTRRQLKSLLAVLQPQINDLQKEIDQLNQTGGSDLVEAHKSELADDHINYLNNTRGDIRYYPKNSIDNTISGINLAIASHEADNTIHFLETSISHHNILDIGDYNHDTIDDFINSKGLVSGIASLGPNGRVPNSQLPALAITDTYVVSGEAAMLALPDIEIGDVAIRTELSKSFILQSEDQSLLESWQELLSPPNEVIAVFGRVGYVAAANNDYTWGQINKTTSNISDITTRDHGSLQNLSDDDHPQYLLSSGGRVVNGNFTVSGIVLADDILVGSSQISLLNSLVTVVLDASNEEISYFLPDVTTCPGRTYAIKKIDSSSNMIIIVADNEDTIDGEAVQYLTSQHDCINVYSDGLVWHII